MPTTVSAMGRFLFTFGVIALFAYVASPMLMPVAMGAVLAVLFYPWMRTLERRKVGPTLAATALTAGITVVFLFPALFLLVSGVKAGLKQIRVLGQLADGGDYVGSGAFARNLVETPALQRGLAFLNKWFSVEPQEAVRTVEDLVRTGGLKLADSLAQIAGHLPSALVALSIAVLSTFFFLLDGRRLVEYLREHSFFDEEQTERLISSFGTMCRSVILATVVSGAAQTLVFFIAAAATGTPNLALVALFVFLFSFVPLVGSTPATFAVVVYHAAMGSYASAAVLAVIAGFVTVLDNFIRPWVLKGAGNLHPLLAFVAAFGGMQMLGVAGVFVGPILAGIFVVTIRILLERKPPSSAAY